MFSAVVINTIVEPGGSLQAAAITTPSLTQTRQTTKEKKPATRTRTSNANESTKRPPRGPDGSHHAPWAGSRSTSGQTSCIHATAVWAGAGVPLGAVFGPAVVWMHWTCPEQTAHLCPVISSEHRDWPQCIFVELLSRPTSSTKLSPTLQNQAAALTTAFCGQNCTEVY